jgi:hypothetical protein
VLDKVIVVSFYPTRCSGSLEAVSLTSLEGDPKPLLQIPPQRCVPVECFCGSWIPICRLLPRSSFDISFVNISFTSPTLVDISFTRQSSNKIKISRAHHNPRAFENA